MSKSKSCALAIMALSLNLGVAHARPIQIVGAVYGTLATGKTCDATVAVSSMCNGRPICGVKIGNTLCADSDFLAVKQARITYRCGRKTRFVVVDEYKTSTIACD